MFWPRCEATAAVDQRSRPGQAGRRRITTHGLRSPWTASAASAMYLPNDLARHPTIRMVVPASAGTTNKSNLGCVLGHPRRSGFGSADRDEDHRRQVTQPLGMPSPVYDATRRAHPALAARQAVSYEPRHFQTPTSRTNPRTRRRSRTPPCAMADAKACCRPSATWPTGLSPRSLADGHRSAPGNRQNGRISARLQSVRCTAPASASGRCWRPVGVAQGPQLLHGPPRRDRLERPCRSDRGLRLEGPALARRRLVEIADVLHPNAAPFARSPSGHCKLVVRRIDRLPRRHGRSVHRRGPGLLASLSKPRTASHPYGGGLNRFEMRGADLVMCHEGDEVHVHRVVPTFEVTRSRSPATLISLKVGAARFRVRRRRDWVKLRLGR